MHTKEVVVATIDGDMVRCGKCHARLFDIVQVFRHGEPNCEIERKCKARHNGKTCNAYNRIYL